MTDPPPRRPGHAIDHALAVVRRQPEEAARFYTSVFPNSQIEGFNRTTEAGPGEPGTV